MKSICKIRFHLLPFYLGRKMHALTLQGRRNWEAIDPLPHPPNYGRNNSKTTFSFKRPPSCIQTFLRSCLCSNTIVVILLVGVDKGQLRTFENSFWYLQFSQKRTKNFTTMVPEVELFSFVFLGELKTPKMTFWN